MLFFSFADDRAGGVDDAALAEDHVADYFVEAQVQHVWLFDHRIKVI